MNSITIMSPGEMGSPIAERIIKSGIRVISPLSGRSKNTIERARKYGIEDSGTLKDSIQDSDLIISILVPDAAENLSKEVSKISKELNKEIYFADLNAISPETVLRMNDILSNGKVKFIDAKVENFQKFRNFWIWKYYFSRFYIIEKMSNFDGRPVIG